MGGTSGRGLATGMGEYSVLLSEAINAKIKSAVQDCRAEFGAVDAWLSEHLCPLRCSDK